MVQQVSDQQTNLTYLLCIEYIINQLALFIWVTWIKIQQKLSVIKMTTH